MIQMRNVLVSVALFTSTVQLVAATSCYCTTNTYINPIFTKPDQPKYVIPTFLYKRCFTGQILDTLFCLDNQNFCLELHSLYPTVCENDPSVRGGLDSLHKRQTGDDRWYEWSQWTDCVASGCDIPGIKTRERNCSVDSNLGQCFGEKIQLTECTKICTTSTIPTTVVLAPWLTWSKWSKCDYTLCNDSVRTRICPVSDPTSCKGSAVEQRSCAVHGDYSEWGHWSACTDVKNQRYKRRQRKCDNPAPLCGGECHGNKDDVKLCLPEVNWLVWSDWSSCINAVGSTDLLIRRRECERLDRDCPGRGLEFKDCLVDAFVVWFEWSQCSVTCGQGVRTRKGSCVDSSNFVPVDDSRCKDKLKESGDCYLANCPGSNLPIWNEWSSWSPCDPPCDSGQSIRNRTCLDSTACSGIQNQTVPCSQSLCKVNGNWSAWEEWNQCKSVNEYNLIVRYRSCSNPPPKNSGEQCTGRSFDIDSCKYESYWGEWANDAGCQPLHDYNTTGVRLRNRTCHMGLSNNKCEGDFEERLTCELHGVWSRWEQWSTCSTTCGQGVKQRSRHCIDRVNPQCQGNAIENQPCQEIEHCAIDGRFSEWSPWTSCQVTCGPGPKLRSRQCSNPSPQYGGKKCEGDFTETSLCNIQACPVDGHWTDWGSWLSCSVSCGNGTRTRERTCTNPRPTNGGSNCVGINKDSGACNHGICSVDGEWGLWEAWTPCTCHNIHSRKRKCDSPAPVAKGVYCIGNDTQQAPCVDSSLECPVDGGWSDWGPWGAVCSVTCDQGTVTRTRDCTNPSPAFGGETCVGDQSQNKACNITYCPVDGSWSSWSAWTQCDVTCQNGSQSRSRTCTKPSPSYGGNTCLGNNIESKVCSLRECPIDGGWSIWGSWSSWDVTCAHASRTRTRNCTNPSPMFLGHPCPGDKNDYDSKELVKCPVNGGWSEWSPWFGCSVTCGPGINTRYRSCDNPQPANHGKICPPQDFKEEIICNTIGCPVDGNWAEWGAWGGCTVTCGNGTREKIRTCTNPPPKYNGKVCAGQSRDNIDCYQGNCPVDGVWSDWNAWQRCSTTCDDGIKLRNRSCDNPEPKYGGEPCAGDSMSNTTCIEDYCPIPGAWGSWLEWGKCSTTCGDGIRLRHRKCDSPAPKYGGANCTGNEEDNGPCNVKPCPIDGQWGIWERWSHCDGPCATATQFRYRTCNNPEPKYNGHYCAGSSKDTVSCIPQTCIVDGSWGSWLAWEKCSATCGNGTRLRHRNCDNPAAQYGGANCTGTNEHQGLCNERHCPINGQWGQWLPWSPCFCANGNRQRYRNCDNPTPDEEGDYCTGDGHQSELCLCSNK